MFWLTVTWYHWCLFLSCWVWWWYLPRPPRAPPLRPLESLPRFLYPNLLPSRSVIDLPATHFRYSRPVVSWWTGEPTSIIMIICKESVSSPSSSAPTASVSRINVCRATSCAIHMSWSKQNEKCSDLATWQQTTNLLFRCMTLNLMTYNSPS